MTPYQLESYAVATRSTDVTRRALRWGEGLAPDLAAFADAFTYAVAQRYVELYSDRVIPARRCDHFWSPVTRNGVLRATCPS